MGRRGPKPRYFDEYHRRLRQNAKEYYERQKEA